MNKITLSKPKEVVNIDSASAFEAWRKEIRSFFINDLQEYSFRLPELSESENKELTRQVKAYISECGCSTGSFLMSMVFIGTVAWFFISGSRFSDINLRSMLLLGGFTIGGAVVGKVAGLIYARWKLIKLTDRIHQRIKINLMYKLN